jgi:TonB family protein
MRFGGNSVPFLHAPPRPVRGDTSPTPINTAEPEYSDEARRKGIEGVVIVSVLVNEEGVPIDPRVERSLDASLDDKAVECALNYRFRPAIRNGVPTAQRIKIEMNFRLH